MPNKETDVVGTETPETTTTPTAESGEQPETPVTEEDVTSSEGENSQSETEESDARKRQTKEQNAYYASLRRQREKQSSGQKKTPAEESAYQKGYRKAQMDAVKENPYTGSPITSEKDFDIYLQMKELEDEGKDPLKEFPNYVARKLKEAEDEQKAKDEEAQRIQSDIKKQLNELAKTHPECNLAELSKKPDFMKYAETRVGRWTYTEIYEGWMATQGKPTSESRAKEHGTPNPIGAPAKGKKSISEMTDEEFEAYKAKVYGY